MYLVCVMHECIGISTFSPHVRVFDECIVFPPLVAELIDPGIDFEEPIDIFALGFQEMVDLNASNIVSARSV